MSDVDLAAVSDSDVDQVGSIDVAPDAPTDVADAPAETPSDGAAESAYPACQATPVSDDAGAPGGAGGCILDPGGIQVTVPVSISVTVVSVDDVVADACADGLADPIARGAARRIVLRSDTAQEWTLYVHIPGLPTDIVQTGDHLDLTGDVSVNPGMFPFLNQTVVLSRTGQLVLFASSLARFARREGDVAIQVPALDGFGVVVTDDGAICERPHYIGFPDPCTYRGHQALVTTGSQSAIVQPGQTVQIGNLSFSVHAFSPVTDSSGFCDALSNTRMSGFATGP